MQRQLESEQLPSRSERVSGLGGVVADSWPFDSSLGALVLTAEQEYRRA